MYKLTRKMGEAGYLIGFSVQNCWDTGYYGGVGGVLSILDNLVGIGGKGELALEDTFSY